MCSIVELPDGRELRSINDLIHEWPRLTTEVVFFDGPGLVSLEIAALCGEGNTCLCGVDVQTVLNESVTSWEELDYGYRVTAI
jgi:hypothetical protein